MNGRVFLCGYYFAENLGDEILRQSAVELVMRAKPEAKILIPQRLSFGSNLAISAPLKMLLFRLEILCSLVLNSIRCLGVDLVVFGGGGTVSTKSSALTRLEQKLIVGSGRLFGGRVVGLGVQIDAAKLSAKTSEKSSHVSWLLARFDFLWVRDEQSLTIARDLNENLTVVNGGDLAWSHRKVIQAAKCRTLAAGERSAGLRIGISLPARVGTFEVPFQSGILALLSSLATLQTNRVEVWGVSAQEFRQGPITVSDSAFLNAVAEEVGLKYGGIEVLSLPRDGDCSLIAEDLKKYDLLFVGRFHVALMAAVAGVPTVVLSTSRKLRDLAEVLEMSESSSLQLKCESELDPSAIRTVAPGKLSSLISLASSTSDAFLSWHSELYS